MYESFYYEEESLNENSELKEIKSDTKDEDFKEEYNCIDEIFVYFIKFLLKLI